MHQVLGNSVGEVMSQSPHLQRETLLPEAARLLHEKGTQRLFVLDAQKRPLVLTRGDVVQALASLQRQRRRIKGPNRLNSPAARPGRQFEDLVLGDHPTLSPAGAGCPP